MSNPYFKFQKFTVWHDKCSMKVGTDGVLLGAWASAPEARRVLDVGSGTGLIALMMAQRFPEAHITGVEVDADAFRQSRDNVQVSPWSGRIELVHADFRLWKPVADAQFDLIVSNPPYFIDALRPSAEGRSLARHAAGLNYESLFSHSRDLLAEGGRVCVIVPAEVAQLVQNTAVKYGLYPFTRVHVFTKQGKPLKRMMISFGTHIVPCHDNHLCLMDSDGTYSSAYRQLTADFYLKL